MNTFAKKLTWRQKIKGHVSGPVGSILFHALLITLMIRFLTGADFRETRQETRIDLIAPKEPIPIPVPLPDDVTPDGPMAQGPDVPLPFPSPDKPEAPPAATIALDPENLVKMDVAGGPVTTIFIKDPKLTERTEKVRINTPPEVHNAVLRALNWLRDNQNPDGSWNSSHQVGNTGLGLLTFFAHGAGMDDPQYGVTVEKALRYLLAHVRENGEFDAARGHAYVYEHAIGTYALADAYLLTHIPEVKLKLERAVNVLLKGQLAASGGWDYGYDPASSRNDASVSAWQVQALKAVLISGAEVPGVLEALEKSLGGMRALQDKASGEFAYSSQTPRHNPGLTALGVLSFQYAGQKDSPEARKGLTALKGVKATTDLSDWPFYSWYYITQAKYLAKGAVWDEWNRQITTRLMTSQARDGSWTSVAAGEKDLGRAYTTTLAALSLQVYSKHLSTSGDRALAMPARRDAPLQAGDDIGIRL
mgnify:CR=1 FL=1